jgi:hypothetical protein
MASGVSRKSNLSKTAGAECRLNRLPAQMGNAVFGVKALRPVHASKHPGVALPRFGGQEQVQRRPVPMRFDP